MNRIGFVGTGHIAAPMVRFLAAKGHEITVTRRNAKLSASLAEELGVDVGNPQSVVDASDIIFLCLRPHLAAEVLEPLRFRGDHRIVSVMAAVPESHLVNLCAPASTVVQTIPLGFLQTGGCPLAAHGDDRLLAELFEPENPVVKVPDEAAMNAHFAICAMVPGLLDLMNTGAAWLTEQTGDAHAAEYYTSQLVSGFLAAMDKSGPGRLAEERDALATDGTLSLQMTGTLQAGKAHDSLKQALNAIGKRLEKTHD